MKKLKQWKKINFLVALYFEYVIIFVHKNEYTFYKFDIQSPKNKMYNLCKLTYDLI